MMSDLGSDPGSGYPRYQHTLADAAAVLPASWFAHCVFQKKMLKNILVALRNHPWKSYFLFDTPCICSAYPVALPCHPWKCITMLPLISFGGYDEIEKMKKVDEKKCE